ncbi:hypothetical protein [Ferrovibrio xuzhouensis]|uniref:Uncharacterized protein n=1 Tax=Ferrovibrio xuzhouensis TaxID=1576914 RepID=A0ABV7VCU3_9PROT
MSADWNLTQAWAWIRWRDPAKVAAYASESHLGIAEEIVFPDGVPVVEDDHRGALLRALQGGGLVARGMAAASGAAPTAVAIAAADWQTLVPVAPSEARHTTGRKVAWRGLSFAAADLTRLWPGRGGATPQRTSLLA